jgi:hypothetical protein
LGWNCKIHCIAGVWIENGDHCVRMEEVEVEVGLEPSEAGSDFVIIWMLAELTSVTKCHCLFAVVRYVVHLHQHTFQLSPICRKVGVDMSGAYSGIVNRLYQSVHLEPSFRHGMSHHSLPLHLMSISINSFQFRLFMCPYGPRKWQEHWVCVRHLPQTARVTGTTFTLGSQRRPYSSLPVSHLPQTNSHNISFRFSLLPPTVSPYHSASSFALPLVIYYQSQFSPSRHHNGINLMSTPPPEPVDDASTQVDTTLTSIEETVYVVPAEDSSPPAEPVYAVTGQDAVEAEPVYLVETTKDQIETFPPSEPVFIAARRASTITTNTPHDPVFIATRVSTAGTSAPPDPVPTASITEVVSVHRPSTSVSSEARVIVEANESRRRSTIRRVNTLLKKITTTKTEKNFTKGNTSTSVVDRVPSQADAGEIVQKATKKRRFARLRDLIRFVLLALKLVRKGVLKKHPVREIPKEEVIVKDAPVQVTEVPISEAPPIARSTKTV